LGYVAVSKFGHYGWIDRNNPEAAGRCDGGGEIRKLRDLKKQMEWRANRLVWTGMMKCVHHLDRPQPQDKLYVLKVDPMPLKNVRPDIDWAFVKSALTYPDGSAVCGVEASDWLTSMIDEISSEPSVPPPPISNTAIYDESLYDDGKTYE
jgi:hypothetical protein